MSSWQRSVGILPSTNLTSVSWLIRECFHISREFWGEGEGGAVSGDFAYALRHTWESYLLGILQAGSREEGTRLALALHEELIALGSEDPLSF